MWRLRFTAGLAIGGGAVAAYWTYRTLRHPGGQSWLNPTLWWVYSAAFAVQSVTYWRRRRRVPSVVGRKYVEAKGVLEEVGLRLRLDRDIEADGVSPDDVVAQIPRAGRLALEGSDVSVSLAKPKRRT